MLIAARSAGGMVVSPHHLASGAGLAVLRRGGSAAEAAVATAAALAVVYPHMNSIGGDSFWLVKQPGSAPIGIDACGRAGHLVDADLYARNGLDAVPRRGPFAANTVAGTISGWAKLLDLCGGALTPADLLAEAIRFAEEGIVVGPGLADTIATARQELEGFAAFAALFTPRGKPLACGERLVQPALAATLRRLASDGLDSFYRGAIAADLAADLASAGAPIDAADLAAHESVTVTPLRARIAGADLYNMPPPTQGVASLLILALFDRLVCERAESFEHIHGLVEATKLAFRLRNTHVGDPTQNKWSAQDVLSDAEQLEAMAQQINPRAAAPWTTGATTGDTVWFGAIDRTGCAVSAIQSTYFEFGSGLILPRTGIIWQNRGCSFSLGAQGPNRLRPRAKPFHTLNPALATFDDGRIMAYGAMGGEGQPQTQAAIFTRYARFNQDLQQAVTAPRWLLGRTWGDEATSLKVEDRFPRAIIDRLRAAGHEIEIVAPFTSLMGHAGAIARWPDGALEGASDPRSEGAVAAY